MCVYNTTNLVPSWGGIEAAALSALIESRLEVGAAYFVVTKIWLVQEYSANVGVVVSPLGFGVGTGLPPSIWDTGCVINSNGK